MRLVEFSPDHVNGMRLRHFDRLGAVAIQGVREHLEFNKARGPSWSLEHDGDIVACAGVLVLEPGRGDAWALTSELVHRYPLAFHRRVKWCLADIMSNFNLHRIQCVCDCEHATSLKWLNRLGFTPEGRLRQFTGDGRDVFILAKLRGNHGN